MKLRLPEGVLAGRRALSDSARAAYVRQMFGAVAPRYDRTNTVISAGLHRPWKRATVAALRLRPGERVVDLCCGTGDLARLMAAAVGPSGLVIGVDFARPMIAMARRRTEPSPPSRRDPSRRAPAPIAWVLGDALAPPLGAAGVDAVAVGFGLRNVAAPSTCLRAIRDMLRPGGRLVVLEFARVPNLLVRLLYLAYSFTVMPLLGSLASRHRDAYVYLPVSIRHWLDQGAMLRLLAEVGFHRPTYRNLGRGVVAVYRAEA